MIEVAETTVKVVAAVAPKVTAVAPVKPVPVMVTVVPPVVGPPVGLERVTVGGGLVGELVGDRGGRGPAGVVTVTSTVPAAGRGGGGDGGGRVDGEGGRRVVPKATAVAPVKPVPVMVTVVPPAAGPEVGLSEVTVGAAT